MATVSCETRVGIASAASSVAWAGGGSRRKFVDWLPKLSEPIGVARGEKVYLTEQMWNFLRELSDRVGGVNGASIPQVQSTVAATQAQVAETTNYAVQVSDYATQVAATASATAQVAANNSLSGSGSIPSTGSPPNRPNTYVQ
jgi:hypothetical protein